MFQNIVDGKWSGIIIDSLYYQWYYMYIVIFKIDFFVNIKTFVIIFKYLTHLNGP